VAGRYKCLCKKVMIHMSTVLEPDLDIPARLIGDRPTEHGQAITIRISMQRVLRVLLSVVATLVITGTAANVISHHVAPTPEHKLAKLMNRFDLNFEPSIPAWYSASALLVSSGLLFVIGISKWQAKDSLFKHWLVLGILFLGLSADEAARFHEMIHIVIVSQIEVSGIFYFPWVVPALIFVGFVGICYIPFLRKLDRRSAKLFLAAGAIYVMGAVGMEIIAGPLAERFGFLSTPHVICEVIEETLEMLGIVTFIYALLDYLARCLQPIRFQVIAASRS
jgi:hypothetical protein